MSSFDIKNMSRIDRIQAMESLWNSFLEEEYELESPDWHRDILEERKKKIETGTAEWISLADLKAENKS